MKSTIMFIAIFSLALIFNPFNVISQSTPSPEWIKVEGNRFINESGKTMIFHGVNFSDPDKLVKAGRWQKAHFEEAKNWGANIIRLPIHPSAWRERGSENYIALSPQKIVSL